MDEDQKRGHIGVAEQLLKQIPEFEEIIPFIKYHHEKVDGSGMPDGLKGNQIPLGAQIIAVANVLDNLITYGGQGQQGLTIKAAITEIQSQTNIEFAEKVVSALSASHKKDTLFSTPVSLLDEPR
jgi:HD-GYP domain-containing protein (c-di-GMP phosphodiesterase class II)